MKHYLEADSILLEQGLRKTLSDIYIKLETGNITGLLGRNGAGKTCLMKIIYGTMNPTNKSIRMDGKYMDYPFKTPAFLTYLPQINFIPKSLNINRIFADFNLDIPAFLSFFPELTGRLRSPMATLSGGERRLIEVYVIIKSDSMFSMLDEPFTLLMPLQIEKIKMLLIHEKVNKGFLITDHLYTETMSVCDNIYLLNNGKTYPAAITDLEKHGYLSSINRVH